MRPDAAPARWLIPLSLCLTLTAVHGCSEQPRDFAAKDGGPPSLRTVSLASLDGFPPQVRAQIQDQHSQVQALSEQGADPDRLGQAYGRLGQLLLAYELNRPAEPALLNAAELLPEDFRWHYYLGQLYQHTGELERASFHLERVLELEPDYSAAGIGLAMIYSDLGRPAEAKAILEKAVRRDPDNAMAHLRLGELLATDDPARAIEHYETALRLQPAASSVHYPLALAYRELGDLDRSRELLARRGDQAVQLEDPLFQELGEIRRGAGAYLNRGAGLAARGRYREAATLFERAIEHDSANIPAYLGLGIAAARLGEVEKATRSVEHALRLDPSNSRAHHSLGLLAMLSAEPGAKERAVRHLRAALEADPGNSAAHLPLAIILWRERRCADAIHHFEAFLAARPGNMEARIRQAVCYSYLGDDAQALSSLEGALEAVPEDPRVQDALIRLLAASPDASVRDGERALAMARRLTAAYRQPQTLESLAMAYAEVGQFDKAVRQQQEVIREAQTHGVGPSMLDALNRNLRRYQQGKPSRTPWPLAIFEQ